MKTEELDRIKEKLNEPIYLALDAQSYVDRNGNKVSLQPFGFPDTIRVSGKPRVFFNKYSCDLKGLASLLTPKEIKHLLGVRSLKNWPLIQAMIEASQYGSKYADAYLLGGVTYSSGQEIYVPVQYFKILKREKKVSPAKV